MDAQLAVDKILETENLTDGLDDDAANWLLDWGTDHVRPLIAGIADDDAAGDKVNQLMAVMRKINQIVADRGTASAKELSADIHSFINLYSKAFGIVRQHSKQDLQQTVSTITAKSPQEAIQALLAVVEPTSPAPDPGKAAKPGPSTTNLE